MAKGKRILWFKELGKDDIPKVGGKGANLGEVSKIVPVPPGFCVSVDMYASFLEETGIAEKINAMLDALDVEDTKELEKVAKAIRELILARPMPKVMQDEILEAYSKLDGMKVAVRSSATAEDLPSASFAGQQDTYLNIEGNSKVIESVRKCWASLFTARAIYYRVTNRFSHRDVLISVVIQVMVDPLYAGVMFTVDPVNKKDVLIEVVEGLGEQLVSGQVTPNTYFLKREDSAINQEYEHFPFPKELLAQIAATGKELEAHYKKPQDIEFALDKKRKLWILQARPITTL